MRFSRYFIDRPILAGVLSIVILIAGLVSMGRLPVGEYPEVTPPSIVVRAMYPGANPRVLSQTVAGPIEIRLWVLSWGDDVEVLEPETLRADVAATLRRAAARYPD